MSETDKGRKFARWQLAFMTLVVAAIALWVRDVELLTGFAPFYFGSVVAAGYDVVAMGVKRRTSNPAVIEAEAQVQRQGGGSE